MIDKIMGIGKKSENIPEEEETQEDLTVKEVSCSICLEIVAFRGDRSTARLQCGHEFHLDCIGSAFNAKGSMQCPNCRKIEKGNWLYANKPSRNPIPDLNMMDEWTHDEDLYDLTYSEMPLGLHWCPFGGRFTQFSNFLEDGGETPPPLTFPELFRQHGLYTEQVATGHPYLYLNQIPAPPSSLPHPHHHPPEMTVLGQPLQPIHPPPPHPPPSSEYQYHSWNPFQYTGLVPRGGLPGNNNGVSEREQNRRANHLYDFLGSSGSRARNPTSLVPPLIPQFMRSEAQNMPDPYATPSSSSSGSMFQRRSNNAGHVPPPSQHDSTTPFCLFPPTSSNSSNVPTEDDGGNRFYAWERDRFAPYPLMPVEAGETGWWGQSSEGEQRRFWPPVRRSPDGSSYRGPRMQSFM